MNKVKNKINNRIINKNGLKKGTINENEVSVAAAISWHFIF